MIIPLFLEVGEYAINKLTDLLKRNDLLFKRTLLITDEKVYNIIGMDIEHLLKTQGSNIRKIYIKGNTTQWVKKVKKEIIIFSPHIILAVGGGKVIDVTKYAASFGDINFISIPSLLSNDGILSPVAVIDGHSLGAKIPIGVIIDLKVLKQSPKRNIRAGIGDLISNLSAVEDCKLAIRKNKDKINNFALLISEVAAELILDNDQLDISSTKFIKRLAEGMMLGGIAMAIANSSRPASGSEHEISHAIDEIFPSKALHGEQVAIGTIFTLYLQRNLNFEKVRNFFRYYGVPTKLSDLQLSLDDFVKVVIHAPSTRKGRYTILEELSMDEDRIKDAAIESGIC